MSPFEPGEARWIERLGNLRNVVRQEVMARQLAGHAEAAMRPTDSRTLGPTFPPSVWR